MPSRRVSLRSFRLRARDSRRLRLGLPRAARPPATLAVVGGLVAAVIGTGHPASGAARPSTAQQPIATASLAQQVRLDEPLADGVTVARALGALSAGDKREPGHASRSSARQPLHHHQAPAHRWVRPNSGPLTSPFGYRWGRLHAGIDLAGPYGSPILAATDGCITYAGPMAGYGEVMQIRDWDGTETVYGHMSAFVRTSGCVKAGQVIARVGAAGDATGAHLHFEVHVGGAPVDPIPFLAKRHLYI